jgi:peptidoglycan/LPS O-acetylase OafA/YrhL
MNRERYSELDGLRGVCALFVVFSHFIQVYPVTWNLIAGVTHVHGFGDPFFWLLKTPVALLFSGTQAVMVFFVLSGFVLSLTFERSDQEQYAPYIVKRVWRIWPPYAFAILIAATLVFFIKPTPVHGLSVWLNTWLWHTTFNFEDLLGHLFMVRETAFLDSPAWSLVHEMRISAAMPLIYFGLKRRPAATTLVLIFIGLVSDLILPYISNPWLRTTISTAQYMYLFCLGGLVYMNVRRIQAFWRDHSALKAALWVVTITTLVLAYALDPLTSHKLIAGAGAFGLVVLCLCSDSAGRILTLPLIAWLGKISYSLYLIHLPITLAILHLFGDRAFITPLLAASLMASLGAAALMNRFIEQPAQQLGRKLAAPLNRRRDPRGTRSDERSPPKHTQG